MEKIVTRESLTSLITAGTPKSIEAIGRALVHLMNRQEEDEKDATHTKYHNAKGFTPADARAGTISAFYFLKHRTLLDWQIEKWTRLNANGVPRLAKYWKQLNEVANERIAA